MARLTLPLSSTKIDKARPTDSPYKLYDGGGLQLKVFPNGRKKWLLDFTKPGSKKRSTLSLGEYPTTSLDEARTLRSQQHQLLKQGLDPAEQRRLGDKAASFRRSNTFSVIAQQWMEVKRHDVSEDYAHDIWRSLELHALPTIGEIPISDITAPMVIDMLKPLAASGTLEQVRRVNQRLNAVMTFAVHTGLLKANPLLKISAAFKKPKAKSQPTIAPNQLPKLMADIAMMNVKSVTRLLMEFQLHTVYRPGEAAKLRWQDVDLEQQLIRIPSERMKSRREHLIPISEQVMEILQRMKTISGELEYVFPGDRNPHTHRCTQCVNAALKRGGYKSLLTSHGLRSIFSTAANEFWLNHHYPNADDIIEAALSHLINNETRRAYNRADYLEPRRYLMAWWSNIISDAKCGITPGIK